MTPSRAISLARGSSALLGDRSGQAATLGVAACLALGLKLAYARADADDLDFVLAPTTALVGAATGLAFEREPGVGYLSREAVYLIAPACAGLNFAIAAFASLVLGFTPRHAHLPARAARLALFAGLALAVTPLANAIRITLDLKLEPPSTFPDLSRAELHRLEGIVVYLVSLWLLHAAAERVLATDLPAPALARILLPLAIYLTITLAIPLLNPRSSPNLLGPTPVRSGFPSHARVVLATSVALAAAFAALQHARARLRARRR